MEHYIQVFAQTHKILNTFTNDALAMKRFIEDDWIHRGHSIYLMICKNGHPVVTTKATKRLDAPLRTETELGFDLKKYLAVESLSNLSLWHHSKTSANKDILSSVNETTDLLMIIHYVLYQILLNDKAILSYGEANILNIKSMSKMGIAIEKVTNAITGIGMPIQGVVINKTNMKHFMQLHNFDNLFDKYFKRNY